MNTQVHSHKKSESVSSVNSNLLAEQFERDRKSIIYYCFTKHGLDKHGAPIHQYYTHVRVIEDQLYNNSKPPTNYQSLLTNKKKRVLIVSYNKQLKEPQIHKARENTDGSIQIGRTWLLKELKQVVNNKDNKEGFLLNMNKLYYWETNSGRERTAFIKTLVKIYMDHFANQVPELIGWDLGMWYLNEASYQNALMMNKHTKQSAMNGLNSQPIVNQRVTSNLPLQDTPVNDIKSTDHLKSTVKYHHRRSPSVQGTPNIESIQENEAFKETLSNAQSPTVKSPFYKGENKITSAEIESIKLKASTLESENSLAETKKTDTHNPNGHVLIKQSVFKNNDSSIKENQKKLEETTKSVPNCEIQQPLHISSNIYSHDSTIEVTAGLVDFYDEDGDTQQLQIITDSNSTRNQVSTHKKISNAELKNAESVDLEKQLEFELLNLNKPLMKTEKQSVKPIETEQVYEFNESNLVDDELCVEPIDFNSIETEQKETSININSENVETINEDSEIDEAALLQIIDAINWSKEDDMRTLIDKLESKYLSVTNVYNENLLQICNDYNAENEQSSFNKVLDSIKENYENVEKVQLLFKAEYSKYEKETYALMKTGNNIQISSNNKKQLIMSINKVIKDVNIPTSDLLLLKKISISTDKLYEIEPILQKLSVALALIRGANQQINDSVSSESWANNLKEFREKSNLFEAASKSFIERFLLFFKSAILKRLRIKFSISELSNIIPYNGIMLFIKLVSSADYQKMLTEFNSCMNTVYSKLIDDKLADLKELIKPRKATIVGRNSSGDFGHVLPLFSSQSSHPQGSIDVSSSTSNQSSNITGSMLTSSISLLEFRNLESLLETWKHYTSNKKIDILKNYNEPALLLSVLKALTFLKTLPLNYQNFISVFFHINDDESSHDIQLFLSKYKVPSQRIINLNVPIAISHQQKSSTLELKWNLVYEMFNFKMSNFAVVVTTLLKTKHGHLLNSLLLFVENELLVFSAAKETSQFLFIQGIFKMLMYKIKSDLLEFLQEKSIALDKFNLSISKENLGTCSQKFTPIVQDFITYFYTVNQDLLFLIENLPIENFKSHKWETQSLVEKNYLTLSELISRNFISVTKLLKENNEMQTISTNSLVMENDIITESIINMNFLNNYCIDFLPFLDNEKLTSTILTTIRKENNEFYKLHLSEILIKNNLLKIYVFVKSAWAIINTNNNNENDPSKYVAYSGTNLNQILIDYDSTTIVKLISNIYNQLSEYTSLLEKLWSNLQGDFVSFFLKLYSLVDKFYSRGPNKIETSLKFNKNDIIQAFINIKKEKNLP
ncbi:hypothetical protein QEN19_004109 [Hanseniaspora menglaensis]